MPCSQMTSMNCRPPRTEAEMAELPAANARILNRSRWNMGSATLISMAEDEQEGAAADIPASTGGPPHPIVWPPLGWMP